MDRLTQPRLSAGFHATRFSGRNNEYVFQIPLGEFTDASPTNPCPTFSFPTSEVQLDFQVPAANP